MTAKDSDAHKSIRDFFPKMVAMADAIDHVDDAHIGRELETVLAQLDENGARALSGVLTRFVRLMENIGKQRGA